jgi:ribosome-binding factor A
MSKQETRRGRHAGDPQAAGHRHERLSRLFREELDAVIRDELGDPLLDGVRLTYVELSVDYKHARVAFVGPGGADTPREVRDRMARALGRATPFLRARLVESVELKQVPALRFAWDAIAAAEPEEG